MDKTPQQFFDQYAATYEQELNHQLHSFGTNQTIFAQKKARILKFLFSRNFHGNECPSILDFGCGIGGFFSVVNRFFENFNYTGYDPSTESIRKAQEVFCDNKSRFFSSLHQVGNGYSLIVVACVLHHVLGKSERLKLISFLLSILLKNGRVVFFEHNPYNPLTRKVVRDCVFDKDADLLTCNALEKLVLEAGGHVREEGYYGFLPFDNKVSARLEQILNSVPLGAQYYLSCTI